MLESLFGSQNVQKILLFLFVNGKAYGSQLQRLFSSSLTPLQKGLARLENGGILRSYFEGKTRIYEFNPAYPLLKELEGLLKRAYTLLAPMEKKAFSLIRERRYLESILHKEVDSILTTFWKRLTKVKEVFFTVNIDGEKQRGRAGVQIEEEVNELIFRERGTWEERGTSFNNVYRWTFDQKNGLISLEHLRFGKNHPFLLFHLTGNPSGVLTSVDSHLEEGDTHFGQASFDAKNLYLHWRAIGESKNEEVDYIYS